ncbi:SDR family NAD(P)-dependent oxidoreductase [Rhodothermus marinus]|uniref:Short-chain dehydrogenase/reductase SDR n=1 Tax=Rhodothermus marinus (strain ATCC 43812 / DSM 4252 / R-10) TaxID=518766 RepID=D0MIP1_RHOM4|nr:SDR family NAD(P)-dependent oxidoreductase [Rhodothermus marinus]ACY48349.1 short-chain dehydrogenase/reductase SDR [Rhodothermus marinus DSM 4252]
MTLKDQTVLLTGAARGIGQATAVALAERGAHVIGVDLHADDMAETARRVEALGRRFLALEADVADREAVRRVVDEAVAAGGFSVLVNNAGVLPSGPFAKIDFSVWARTIDVDLTGLMALTHAALPHLLAQPRAHIVNIASIAGKFGASGLAAYCAAKHGVVGFSEALRFELRHTRVGVSCICPTMVTTRLIEGVRRSPLVPLARPEDVARAVVRAIEHDLPEVFVPRYMRLLVEVLPAVVPPLFRWLVHRDAAADGWLEARRPLPE